MYYDRFDIKSKFGETALHALDAVGFSFVGDEIDYALDGKQQQCDARKIVISIDGRSYMITEFQVRDSYKSLYLINEF